MKLLIRPVQIRIRRPRITSVPVQDFALAAASLLTPCALIAFTLALWNIAADLRWTASFFVSSGLFSHWQVWLGSAAAMLLLARVLSRHGQ